MAQGKFVAYYRVSTVRQGQSGLGLEAQREAVAAYLNGGQWELLAEFTEVETGKGANALDKRPQLKAALDYAREQHATLVIAKLDRLARNVHFITGLMQESVPIVAADMPHANIAMLQIYAVMAEDEGRRISQRTRDALAIAKARGTVLGRHWKELAVQRKAQALGRLAPVSERLAALKTQGLTVRAIAEQLNAEGLMSPAGGAWQSGNVHRALKRLEGGA